MDVCTKPSSAERNSASPARAPAPGFYQTELETFYATSRGALYLLREPGQSPRLQPWRALPADAIPFTPQREPDLDTLGATAEEFESASLRRRQALEEEIHRDASVLHEALVRDLASLQAEFGTGLHDVCPSHVLELLQDRLSACVWHSIEATRRLSTERVNRRGERPSLPPPATTVPLEARPFLHRGDYVGSFPNVEAAAEALADRLLPSSAPPATRLLNAHLDGVLWTLPRDGQLLVFVCPPGGGR